MGTVLRTCQTIFGVERGDELTAFVERATGQPCPCAQGRPCPLMPPADVVPAPRVRGEIGELRLVASVALAGYGLVAMKVGSIIL